MIEKQLAYTLRKMTSKFKALKGISYVIGVVDGSHVSIITPPIDPTAYYCRGGYYSFLLQGIVDNKCRFWNYDFEWVGRCHGWTLFQNSEIGKRMTRDELLPYKLICDAAYPIRPWFY